MARSLVCYMDYPGEAVCGQVVIVYVAMFHSSLIPSAMCIA